MVLIIRNNRILSSRQTRINRFFSYVDKNRERLGHNEFVCDRNKGPNMSLTTVLGTLFLYSVAMFTLPFAVFFGVQHLMKVEFHTDRFVTNCVSVFAAVVMVNLIISCYAYQALHEPDNETESQEIVDHASKDSLNKKSE